MMLFFMVVAKELGKLENYRTEKEFQDQHVSWFKMASTLFEDSVLPWSQELASGWPKEENFH